MSRSNENAGPAVLLRVDEVARMLGISVRTVCRLVSPDELAAPVSIGRCKRWHRSDIEAFVSSLDD